MSRRRAHHIPRSLCAWGCGVCVTQNRPTPVHPYPFALGFRFPKVVPLAQRSRFIQPYSFNLRSGGRRRSFIGGHTTKSYRLPLSMKSLPEIIPRFPINILGATGAHLLLARQRKATVFHRRIAPEVRRKCEEVGVAPLRLELAVFNSCGKAAVSWLLLGARGNSWSSGELLAILGIHSLRQ